MGLRISLAFLGALLVCSFSACGGLGSAVVDDGHAPPLERVVRVFEKASGREIALESMLDALAGADVVFCGETHLDDVTHRVEGAIHAGLLARRGGRVVLAMEMFSTDAQPAIDAYLAGKIDERSFRAQSHPWGNYDTGYRPMVERARAAGAPVVGSNAPQLVARKVSAGGAKALAELAPEERALLPDALLANSTAYWERFDRATRGHAGMGGAGDADKLLFSMQSLWDNTMGWSCARALQRWPGHLVLHVNGGFHTAHGEGTAAQCRLRRPDARIATVAIELAQDLAAVEFARATADGDYVVFAAVRARGLDEGTHAVASHREQRYRVRVPATASGPVPLLVWLPGDGLRSDDALATWVAAVGDAAAIAVLEPQFGQIEPDLRRGGRWFFAETFSGDVGAAGATVETIVEYVTRHWPIDPARVVVAGEGSGATVAVAAALWGDAEGQTVLAFAPAGHRKFAEQGVPEHATEVGSLRVYAAEAEHPFWQQEFAAHAHRKLPAKVIADADPIATVRSELGIAAAAASATARALVLPPTTSVLGRQWQRTAVAMLGRDGAAVRELTPDDAAVDASTRVLLVAGEAPSLEATLAAQGFAPADAVAAGLPPAPGQFGGTTIVVVPAGSPAAVREAWRQAAAANPMQRHGRFFRMELAFEDEAPRLADALEAMVAARRRNVLVVPARFCAEASVMQALAREAAPFEGRVDITWLPGLGGRLAGSLVP